MLRQPKITLFFRFTPELHKTIVSLDYLSRYCPFDPRLAPSTQGRAKPARSLTETPGELNPSENDRPCGETTRKRIAE